MSAPLVLVIEDEPDLARSLENAFQLAGFEVVCAGSGRLGIDLAVARTPNAILLDLLLPDLGGIEVCRALKRESATRPIPIVIASAKGEEVDRVLGFEAGADDYIVKPYSLREVVLRMRAVLRRAAGRPAASRFVAGAVIIDTAAHRVWVQGREVRLTAREFKLLAALAARSGRVVTRRTLVSEVWAVEANIEPRTVDTHLKRLREKLGEHGSAIETVRGVGYRLGGRAGPRGVES